MLNITKNYAVIDFEATDLPTSVVKRIDPQTGITELLSPKEAFKDYRHINVMEFAYYNPSSIGDRIKHFSINFNNRYTRNIIPGTIRNVIHPSIGPAKVSRRQLYKESDVIDEIKSPYSKLKNRAARDYIESGIPRASARRTRDLLYEITMPDGTKKILSEYALNLQLNAGVFDKTGLKAKKYREEIKALGDIDFAYLSQREFSGKGSGSLYQFVSDILKTATKKDPFTLWAWNVGYDANIIMSQLVQFGHGDVAKRLYEAYKSGAFKLGELEKAWTSIVFTIAKEDPEFGKIFKIGLNPSAAINTGRPGKTPINFNEFQHAIPWNADWVSSLLNKHFKQNLSQIHSAGADVKNEVAIAEELSSLLDKMGIGIHGNIAADKEGNASKILEAILEENGSSLQSFKKEIIKKVESINSYNKFSTSIKGAELSKPTIKSLAKSFGGLGLALGLGLLMTYANGGREEDINSSGIRFSGRGNFNKKSFNKFLEDDPTFSNRVGALALGIATPLSFLYGVGLDHRLNSRKLLGVDHGGLSNYSRNIFGNIYMGIKKLETSLPITRVFRAIPLIDYTHKTFSEKSRFDKFLNEEIYDSISFYNIRTRNGKTEIRGTYGKNKKIAHGREFSDLLEAAKITNPDKYTELSELLNPSEIPSGVTSQQVRISRLKGGGTLVSSGDKKIYIDANVKFGKLRISKDYVNSVEWSLSQRIHVKNNIVRRKTFEEYLLDRSKSMPDFIKKSPSLLPLYSLYERIRYNLDLAPKSIGEAANELFGDMAKKMTNLNTSISVTGLTGKSLGSLQDIKFRYRSFATPFRATLIEGMNTFLESPFEIPGVGTKYIDNLVKKLKGSNSYTSYITGSIIDKIARPRLGLPIYAGKYGTLGYIGHIATKRLLPAALAIGGIDLLDHALGKVTFSEDGKGPIIGGAIGAWQGVNLLYAKLSDITGFTTIAKKQEKYAPGSTGIGFFAPALSGLSIYKSAELLYKYGPRGIKSNIDNLGSWLKNKSALSTTITNALKQEAYKGAIKKTSFERALSFGIKNPKIGLFSLLMMPALPFLPGFIGSNKSYDELKDEYKGEKEVAIRKYRGWLLSSSPFAGGKPIQFRRHASNIINSDYVNRGVIWPSYKDHLLHNITGGLYGRYTLEEYHKESQPVYESSPYGSNIPLVGPIIASTIGRVIKPTVTYHQLGQMGLNVNVGSSEYSNPSKEIITESYNNSKQLASSIGIESQGSNYNLYQKFASHYRDLIGFRGFLWETGKQYITGKSSDEYIPYAQDAGEMYNFAQLMWGFRAGDITGFGGEFLRRIFPYPRKQWVVNDIKNELYGVSWIPQQKEGETSYRDLTHGTTFDKIPMGWLYGSRKGWEFLHPELKNKELEDYPDHLRLEILKNIAPYSKELNHTAKNVLEMTNKNMLSPKQEQQFYETLNQVRQLKDQLYVHSGEFGYNVDTENVTGKISSVGDDGSFSIEGDKNIYRLAGVSTNINDIRYSLLQKHSFDTAEELDKASSMVQSGLTKSIHEKLRIGSEISFSRATDSNLPSDKFGIEAIVGNLNEDLISSGAPFLNTGNLASHNMQQDKGGIYSRIMSNYWNFLINDDSYWNKKLIPQRDYLDNYLSTQVFNREVKLWSRPIEHIFKPFVASVMHRIGFDRIPSFTAKRRENQEYWDILKYIKYKALAIQASENGDMEEAAFYHAKWRATMIGSNPMDDDQRDEIAGLPANERAYFSRFANEPDPDKRGEIYKYLPRGARRIYSAIWNKKASITGKNQRVLNNLNETEGWGMTNDEEKRFYRETGGSISKADYIRSKFIKEYAKKHSIPDAQWSGWSPDIDIENVELLSLRDNGENIQDYGFFDDKSRIAAFDHTANLAAIELKSVGNTSKETINNIISYVSRNDNIKDGSYIPTRSQVETREVNIETNEHDQYLIRKNNRYLENIPSFFNLY